VDRKFWFGTLVAALMLAGCGGGDGPGTLDIQYGPDLDQSDTQGLQDIQDDNSSRPDTRDITTTGHLYEIILFHDISTPLDMLVASTLRINAKVIDYSVSSPAVGLRVSYEIVEITNLEGIQVEDGDARFQEIGSYTDGDGFVQNLFLSGIIGDRIYTVHVWLADEEAETKELRIRVADRPCGCANVTLTFDGALPESGLEQIEVYALPNEYTCDKLHLERPIPDAVLYSRLISNLYGKTSFECIPSDQYYTLFARARGGPKVEDDGGALRKCFVASACNDSVFLQPNTCKDVNLKLYQATLNPSGLYDCIDHLDFTNMIKQCAGGNTTIVQCATGATGDVGRTICCALAEMIKFFQTPGYTIIETIQDLAKIWLGSIIVDTLFNLFKDVVARVITDWLKNNSPAWIQDFFTIGEDMMGAITNLEMLSDLTISKLNNDYSLQGSQFWTGVALYWKFGCDTQAPDYEQCGRIELNSKDITAQNFPLDFLGGTFTALLADFNKLVVNQHAIKLNYGRLVLWVLNEVIISGITGGQAHSLREAAALWINCKGISQGVFGQIFEWFGGSRQDVENICVTGVGFLFGFVETFLDALSLDTELSMSGTGTLVDNDCDLKVDRITNGRHVGYVQGNTSQASISGRFEAVKK
jgi:hypothetical protein